MLPFEVDDAPERQSQSQSQSQPPSRSQSQPSLHDDQDQVSVRTRRCKTWLSNSVTVFCLLFMITTVILYGLTRYKLAQLDAEGGQCERQPEAIRAIVRTSTGRGRGAFEELTSEEVTAVIQILRKQLNLPLISLADNQYSMEADYVDVLKALVPLKHEGLAWLADRKAKVARRALALVVFANPSRPRNVSEIEVNLDTGSIKVLNKTVPFYARRIDAPELTAMLAFIEEFFQDDGMKSLLYKLVDRSKCSEGVWSCLKFIWSQPSFLEVKLANGSVVPTRRTWLRLYHNVAGFLLHPMAFEILVDHYATNISEWKVLRILFLQDAFNSSSEVKAKYLNGSGDEFKVDISPSVLNVGLGMYDDARRGEAKKTQTLSAPIDQNYTVEGHEVRYQDWQFMFELKTVQGLGVFDIRFRNERIAYEVSLQDATTFYFGHSGFSASLIFADGQYAFGFMTNRLVRGLDCPDYATFFDSTHYSEGKLRQVDQSVCLFVLDEATPLRRHVEPAQYSSHVCKEQDEQLVTGALQKVLVLRSVMTVYNYDYVIDYKFYSNGVMETRVGLAGYVHTSKLHDVRRFYSSNVQLSEAERYAQPKLGAFFPTEFGYLLYRSGENGANIGQLHNHQMHFKVDVDVGERRNRYERLSASSVDAQLVKPWPLNVQEALNSRTIRNEKESTLNSSLDSPHVHLFRDESNQRAVRLHIDQNSVSKILALNHDEIPKAFSWMKYQLVVTKHNDTESRSSSIYSSANPNFPSSVDIQTFYDDNESIFNEDLVAWVTVGTQHAPRSEDMPSVQSITANVKFTISPFNSYERDPSLDSPDAVHFCYKQD